MRVLRDVVTPPAAALADSLPRLLVSKSDPFRVEAEQCLEQNEKSAWRAFMQRAQSSLIQAALQRAGDNLSRAATLLGISRPTLRARCRRFGLRHDRGEGRPGRRARIGTGS